MVHLVVSLIFVCFSCQLWGAGLDLFLSGVQNALVSLPVPCCGVACRGRASYFLTCCMGLSLALSLHGAIKEADPYPRVPDACALFLLLLLRGSVPRSTLEYEVCCLSSSLTRLSSSRRSVLWVSTL